VKPLIITWYIWNETQPLIMIKTSPATRDVTESRGDGSIIKDPVRNMLRLNLEPTLIRIYQQLTTGIPIPSQITGPPIVQIQTTESFMANSLLPQQILHVNCPINLSLLFMLQEQIQFLVVVILHVP
jgi:hypothetical protein